MKTKVIITLLALSSVIVLLFMSSCQKQVNDKSFQSASPNGLNKQKVMVYLNDDPMNFFKVLVDLRSVELKVDTGSSQHDDSYYSNDSDDDDHNDHDSFGQWDTLNINPGVYDLLKLRNGVDTLLANGYVWHGKITKVRIKLGLNNEVWTDSTTMFPLTICDKKEYVYLEIKSSVLDTLPNGNVRIKLDFDVAKSIKKKDGKYCLKPELKVYSESNTGSIEGKVFPKEAKTMITVYNNTDTAYALPENSGEFKVKGLKEGTYNLYYDGAFPYKDTMITSVKVYKSKETKVSTITLKK